MTQKVVVLGAGGVAFGMAADLVSRGHSVSLWSPSGRGTVGLRRRPEIAATGLLEGVFPATAVVDCAASVAAADVVVFALPANGYRQAIEAAVPAMRPGQLVFLCAPLSLGSLVLARRIADRGVEVTVAACPVPPLNARLVNSGSAVRITGRRKLLEIGTNDEGAGHGLLERIGKFLAVDVVSVGGLLAIEFGNINPVAHAGNLLLNFTRIENGETWFTYGGITPAVGHLTEAIDAERLAVASAYALRARTFSDYLVEWYNLPSGPLAGLAQAIFARGNPTPAPTSLNSRFITEDIPFGLMPLIALGDRKGVAMPLLRSIDALLRRICSANLPSNDLIALPGFEALAGQLTIDELL